MKPLTRAQQRALREARTAQNRLQRNIASMETARDDLHELIAMAHKTGLSSYRITEELDYYSQARVSQVIRKCKS